MSAVSASCAFGVTGHRHLPGADFALLRSRLLDVLGHPARTEARCLATSLAEGADRLVAETALELGYTLFCPLPLPAPEYEKDFDGTESVDAFRRLLASAERVITVPLPDGSSREAGYAGAGRAMLDASRALIALWNGRPPCGLGGTGQIVAEAVTRGLPVLWLASEPPHELRVRLPAREEWEPWNPAHIW